MGSWKRCCNESAFATALSQVTVHVRARNVRGLHSFTSEDCKMFRLKKNCSNKGSKTGILEDYCALRYPAQAFSLIRPSVFPIPCLPLHWMPRHRQQRDGVFAVCLLETQLVCKARSACICTLIVYYSTVYSVWGKGIYSKVFAGTPDQR